MLIGLRTLFADFFLPKMNGNTEGVVERRFSFAFTHLCAKNA